MWYEIIPSILVIGAALTVSPTVNCILNYYFLNGKTIARRWFDHPEDYHGYLRDRRMTGSEYVHRGLESLSESK